jgi:hypothetical protein
LKTDVRQLLLCKVVVGKFNFGLNALHLDQMRTLSKEDSDSIFSNAVKLQLQKYGKEENLDNDQLIWVMMLADL